jgi:hypothetical protein
LVLGNLILNGEIIKASIKRHNRKGIVTSLLALYGPWIEKLREVPHRDLTPAPSNDPITHAPASSPPPPELVMDRNSRFWVDREVERKAIAEYNEAVKSQAQPHQTTGTGEVPDGSRRKRRMPPRN